MLREEAKHTQRERERGGGWCFVSVLISSSIIGCGFMQPPSFTDLIDSAQQSPWITFAWYCIFYSLLPPPRRLCFHRCLFVCQQDYANTTRAIITKFDRKVAHETRNKRVDFDSIKHRLDRAVYSKTGFWPSYCQFKSQPIWIKFCTHILLYGIHLWADLDRDRRVGGSRPNQNDFFCSRPTVTHPTKSYIQGGPTKVKPTYIFVSKIWIKFEWIDKIQWFLVNAI